MTNADRIRKMTDEELVDFLFSEYYCPPGKEAGVCYGGPCDECRLKWLQKEYSHEF